MGNGYAKYSGFGGGSGGGGVTSLNSETGAVVLVAGTGISVTPAGQNITITNTSPSSGGTVTSVSVVSANGLAGTVATATTTPAITLSTTITGLLQGNGTAISAATTGNLTDAGTDGIVITGGTGAVLGSGTSIAQAAASASQNGYLTSTDWSTFNSKQNALTLGNLTDAGTDGITVTGGTGAVVGSGTSLAQHVADTTHNGYLSSTDWNTFNNKQATITIGALDAQAENANGLALVSNVLSSQSADATHPGMVNITTQTFTGVKTMSLNIPSNGYITANTIDFIWPHIAAGAVNDYWIGITPPTSYGGAGNVVLSTLITGSSFVPTSGFNHNVIIGENNLYNATALSGVTVIGGGNTGDNLINQSSTILLGYGISNVKSTASVIIGASSCTDGLMTGNNNTGVGTDSFDQITSSPNNTSIGFQGFPVLTSGSGFNVGLGYKPGVNNLTTGNNNIFIGQEMDAGSGGGAYSDIIAIGHYMQAGASNVGLLGDNAMVFGVGIGTRGSDGSPGSTVTPVARLEIGAGSTTVPSMVLDPATITTSPVHNAIENDGNAIYYTTNAGVRTVLGGGAITAQVQANAALAFTSGSPIVFPVTNYDTNSAYNTSTGVYTAPVTGYYDVMASSWFATVTSSDFYIFVNGSVRSGRYALVNSAIAVDGSFVQQVSLNASDTLTIVPDNSDSLLYSALSGTSGYVPTLTISLRK